MVTAGEPRVVVKVREQNKTPRRAFCDWLGRDAREISLDQLRSAMA